MTRYNFGGDEDAFVSDDLGNRKPGLSGTFWTAQTGGTQHTDVVDANGGTAGAIRSASSPRGQVQFQGPDGIDQGWLDFGNGRVLMRASDAFPVASEFAASLALKLDVTTAGSTYLPVFVVAGAGVDPTGAADSTTAIQAVITACEAAGGGTVYFPKGTYRVTSQLSIHGAAMSSPTGKKGGVVLQGASNRASKIVTTGGFTLFYFDDGLNFKDAMTIRDLWLQGPGKATASSRAIYNGTGGEYDWQRVFITGFETGVQFYDTTHGTMNVVKFRDCGTGIKFGWQSDQHVLISCEARFCDLGYKFGQADGVHTGPGLSENCITLLGGDCSYNTLGWSIFDYDAHAIKFVGFYQEGNTKDGEISSAASPGGAIQGVEFNGCWWDPQAVVAGPAIESFNKAQLTFRNCATPAGKYGTFLKVRNDIQGNQTRLLWEQNNIQATTAAFNFAARNYNPGMDTMAFGMTRQHLMAADLGNLPSLTPLDSTEVTGGTDKVFKSWSRRNGSTNAILGEIQVRDVGGVLRIDGTTATPGYIAATSIAALPTASVNYRGCFAYVPGNGTSTADQLWVCLMSATGTYNWKQAFSGV